SVPFMQRTAWQTSNCGYNSMHQSAACVLGRKRAADRCRQNPSTIKFGDGGDMLIPIPIGAKHVAAVQGAVWKFVSCSSCQQRYAYLLELESTGEDHDLLFLDGKGSAERALAQAEQNLEDDLDGQRTLEVGVDGAQHHAHAAAGDLAHHVIPP